MILYLYNTRKIIMSIRTEIFKNNTTLLGILDKEGIPQNNQRFTDLDQRISALEGSTSQSHAQLVDLSTIVAKNHADFNSFELKTNTTLASLDERVSEAKTLATTANKAAGNANTNADAALGVSEQLATTINKLKTDITAINTKIQTLDTTVKSHTSQIQENLNQIVSIKNQVAKINSPYVIRQRRTKFYYLKGTANAYMDIDWDTPITVDTTVLSNTFYWANVYYSTNNTQQRAQIKLISQWDTFRTVGVIAYPVLQGDVQVQISTPNLLNNFVGTAIVEYPK